VALDTARDDGVGVKPQEGVEFQRFNESLTKIGTHEEACLRENKDSLNDMESVLIEHRRLIDNKINFF
jgi:hypothetical protein